MYMHYYRFLVFYFDEKIIHIYDEQYSGPRNEP